MYRESLRLLEKPEVLLESGMRINRFVFNGLFALLCCVGIGLTGNTLRAQTTPVALPNDSLANVKYDYKWELYGGFAYSHFDAGPTLVQGANLGGFDIQGARFLTHRWAVAGNARGYYGTSGVVPNTHNIQGPFVSEHLFMGGPEFRGPSNEHGSMTFHALAGGAYGSFESAINGVNPDDLGLFHNQFTFASALGGSIDLNRSPRLAFRISPDAILTNYGSAGIKEQFALSVGLIYRLGKSGASKPRK